MTELGLAGKPVPRGCGCWLSRSKHSSCRPCQWRGGWFSPPVSLSHPRPQESHPVSRIPCTRPTGCDVTHIRQTGSGVLEGCRKETSMERWSQPGCTQIPQGDYKHVLIIRPCWARNPPLDAQLFRAAWSPVVRFPRSTRVRETHASGSQRGLHRVLQRAR